MFANESAIVGWRMHDGDLSLSFIIFVFLELIYSSGKKAAAHLNIG